MAGGTTFRDASPAQLYTAGVAGLGALLFLWSGANIASAALNTSDARRSSFAAITEGRRGSTTAGKDDAAVRRGKTTEQSTVQVTHPTTLEMCDNAFYACLSLLHSPQSDDSNVLEALPRIRAGALLKLIDVIAGVSARKHAELSCVTVSVDSVLLLAPIYLGELVHLSASVNRAWGSSLEVGVRVVKEDPRTGSREYVSHAYMTFVAISSPSKSSPGGSQPPARVRLASRQSSKQVSLLGRTLSWISGTSEEPLKAPKPQLQPLIPKTPLEARRHILAGRRRAKRIDNAKKGEARDGVSTEVKKQLKSEVLEISRTGGKWRGPADSDPGTWTPGRLRIEREDLVSAVGSDMSCVPGAKTTQEAELEALELEFVVQAYLSHDPAVTVKRDEGLVEVNLSGDIPLRHPLKVVEKLAQQIRNENVTAGDQTTTLFASRIPEAGTIPLPSPSAAGVTRPLLDVDLDEPAKSPPLAQARRRSVFSPLKPAQDREGDTDLDHSNAGTPIRTVPSQSLSRARFSSKFSKPIKVAKTMARTLHLVFPEHTNSVGVLFGGQLMDWMEEAALLSVRHVGRGKRWATVSLDGLEFEQAVAVGESMTFTAVVVRTFVQSCEVYVLAEAESRTGTRRITNEALFTLAFPLDDLDPAAPAFSNSFGEAWSSSSEAAARPKLLRQVEMPPGSALAKFADVAVKRRESRLELKQMLVRIYSDPS
ncbi:hypothetical protein BCV70DRAFT_195064 [Testicularia cyperi]|uniref:HotDog ACOT-type domain-containing protein n=1 Tax=Testicularia cyperi TaxID=1882483 RepID=A0A317XJA8_9BASI|nr:hypothetical protein BCV70DRAFT_195064 [Testicularia cyperi]